VFSHRFGGTKSFREASGVKQIRMWRYVGELAAHAATLFYASRHLHYYRCNAASKVTMLFLSWEAIGFSVEQSRSACVN
jgi:hypothetical protein